MTAALRACLFLIRSLRERVRQVDLYEIYTRALHYHSNQLSQCRHLLSVRYLRHGQRLQLWSTLRLY